MLLNLYLTNKISKNIKVEPISSTLKKEIMSYCDGLPCGIILLIAILILKQ